MKLLLQALALAGLLVSTACNSAHIDGMAPALVGTNWVHPDGGSSAVTTEGRYVLVEFFSPT